MLVVMEAVVELVAGVMGEEVKNVMVEWEWR